MACVVPVQAKVADYWQEEEGIVSRIDLNNRSFDRPVKHLLLEIPLSDICLQLGKIILPCECVPYEQWFRLKLADNDPALPLHLADGHRIALVSTKHRYQVWPKILYEPLEEECQPYAIFVRKFSYKCVAGAIVVKYGMFHPFRSTHRDSMEYLSTEDVQQQRDVLAAMAVLMGAL